jgi:hypothetical protein
MAYTIGVNCHVILSHINIDGGAPFGFICAADDKVKPGGVRVVRQVISDGANSTTAVWVYFNILLADNLINPDGSRHADTRAQMASKLLQFLQYTSGINLTGPEGTHVNLGALGWCADERHLPDKSQVNCNLNNVGYYWPPVDPDLLNKSVWDGVLTWATSYWR